MIKYCQSVYTGTGVDNIEVDPLTGDLWIGSHPVARRIVDIVTGIKPPGQVGLTKCYITTLVLAPNTLEAAF